MLSGRIGGLRPGSRALQGDNTPQDSSHWLSKAEPACAGFSGVITQQPYALGYGAKPACAGESRLFIQRPYALGYMQSLPA